MERKTVVLDAKGKSLGRVASEAASFLRGKRTPSYAPNKVSGEKVIIKNSALVRVTGRKMGQEARERYSGYPSGLKKIPYKVTFAKDPREFIRKAVSGMIPRNRLKKEIMKNLTIYVIDEK
ncbi:MAG TPA: 50S ribosomal protein L13 [Candidatus Paceibacterota bacterium]